MTDFERLSSGVRRARGVLDEDAGSALRVFRHLAFDPHTDALAPVLVTGRLLLADAVHGPAIVAALQARWEAGCWSSRGSSCSSPLAAMVPRPLAWHR